MTKIVRVFLLIAASGLARAQLAEPFEAALFGQSATNKWSDKALTADITATATVRAPWGVLQSIEHGKYWRNGKGLIRQDDEHGLSLLLDLREPNKRTLIDSRLKVIHSDEWQETIQTGSDGRSIPMLEMEQRSQADGELVITPFGLARGDRRNGSLTDEMEIFFQNYGRLVSPGTREKASLEGMEVTVYKLPYGEGTAEWWVSRDLKFVLVTRYVTEAAEFEMRYHNIRLEKPPDSLFQLPVEYPIRIVDRRLRSEKLKDECSRGYRFTDGLTGQRSKKDGFARSNGLGMKCLTTQEPNVGIRARTLAQLEQPQPAISLAAGGIRVDASVTVHGERVEGLRPEDLVLTEDRRRQPITAMARENLPLDIVLLFPRNTRSFQNHNAAVAQLLQLTAARALLQGSHPEDRVALVSYGIEPRVELPLTANRNAIERAVLSARQSLQLTNSKANAYLRAFPVITSAVETAISMKSLAIDYAIHVLSEPAPASRRKLILMVTDLSQGQFNGNYAGSPDEPVIQRLWDAGIGLSAVGEGIRAPFRDQTRRTPVDAYYRRNNPMHIAHATGGDAMVSEDPQELDYTLTRARERYVLWFDQPSGLVPGQERAIKVDLSPEARKRFPDAVVKARQGYVTR